MAHTVQKLSWCVAMCVVLCTCTNAQKLSTASTGSGISCTIDLAVPGASGGCPPGEGCCPATSTCVKRTSCAEFAQFCPPPSCKAGDNNFRDRECPSDVARSFKNPVGLKCSASSTMSCISNGTMGEPNTVTVLACTSGASSKQAALATALALLVALLVAVGGLY